MNFTSKEEYGLLAVMRLAISEGARPMQAREIARLEDIPEPFLKQVLSVLTRAGITRSVRGASGGYELARSARSITAGDVVKTLGGGFSPIQKTEKPELYSIYALQEKMHAAMSQALDSTTIMDMVEERERINSENFVMMNI